MNYKDSIKNHKEEFLKLCTTHDVDSLYVFGSSTTDKFDEKSSDIDLLVEVNTPDAIKRGENLLILWDKFEKIFQRKVDLLTNSSIKNPFLRKNIDASKILIYDRKEHKIFI